MSETPFAFTLAAITQQLRRVCIPGQREAGDLQRNAVLWIFVLAGGDPNQSSFGFPQGNVPINDRRLTEIAYLAALGFLFGATNFPMNWRSAILGALQRALQRPPHTVEQSGFADDPLEAIGLVLLASSLGQTESAQHVCSHIDEHTITSPFLALAMGMAVPMPNSQPKPLVIQLSQVAELATVILAGRASPELASRVFPAAALVNTEDALMRELCLKGVSAVCDIEAMVTLSALELLLSSAPATSIWQPRTVLFREKVLGEGSQVNVEPVGQKKDKEWEDISRKLLSSERLIRQQAIQRWRSLKDGGLQSPQQILGLAEVVICAPGTPDSESYSLVLLVDPVPVKTRVARAHAFVAGVFEGRSMTLQNVAYGLTSSLEALDVLLTGLESGRAKGATLDSALNAIYRLVSSSPSELDVYLGRVKSIARMYQKNPVAERLSELVAGRGGQEHPYPAAAGATVNLSFPKPLINALRVKKLALFAGSGTSNGGDVTPRFPRWSELPSRLLDACEQYDSLDNQAIQAKRSLFESRMNLEVMLAELGSLRTALGRDYQRALDDIFRPGTARPGKVHNLLCQLDVQAILTTNYDQLFELIHESPRRQPYTWKEADRALGDLRQGRKVLFKVHGTVERHDTVILTEREYHEFHSGQSYRGVLSTLLQDYLFLFVGYGMNDPLDLDMILKGNVETFRSCAQRHYVLMRGASDGDVERYLRDYHVKVIPYAEHGDLPTILEQLILSK